MQCSVRMKAVDLVSLTKQQDKRPRKAGRKGRRGVAHLRISSDAPSATAALGFAECPQCLIIVEVPPVDG